MRDEITNYILNNPIINDYFNKVETEYKDDFRSHIWLIIMEMIEDNNKYETLKSLYKSGDLGRFIVGIITNQLKSNTSSFTKQYKDQNLIYNINTSDIEDTYEEKLNTKLIVMEIITLLNNMYFVDAVLFKLYYGIDPITNTITSPKTYQEIQELIGINYQAVRNSVIKVRKQLEKQIRL